MMLLILGNYTLFTLIFKKFTFMIITFKLFVIFAPNIQLRLERHKIAQSPSESPPRKLNEL